MDFSKFKPYHWLMMAGGVGWIIFGLFVNWIGDEGAPTFNAFDWFVRGAIPWILFVAVGVIAFLLAGGMIQRSGVPWPLILLGATALGTLLNLFLILAGPDVDGVPGDLKRGIGLWLSFLSALVSLAGAVMYFMGSGGKFADLTNANTYKSGGSSGSRSSGGYQQPGNNPPPPPPQGP